MPNMGIEPAALRSLASESSGFCFFCKHITVQVLMLALIKHEFPIIYCVVLLVSQCFFCNSFLQALTFGFFFWFPSLPVQEGIPQLVSILA